MLTFVCQFHFKAGRGGLQIVVFFLRAVPVFLAMIVWVDISLDSLYFYYILRTETFHSPLSLQKPVVRRSNV